MGTIFGIIVALALVFCLLFAGGCSSRTSPSPASSTPTLPAVTTIVTTAELKSLNRAAVRALLKKLADSPPPKHLALGAMCYEPMSRIARADYVCPKCGERTLYENNKSREYIAEIVERGIPCCRREFDKLRRVANEAFSLDELQFCRKCSPTVVEPKLTLHISYADGKTRDVENISYIDLRILHELLSGKLVSKDGRDRESPLKDSLPRLEELLGVKPDE